ncbi:MAG TPA: efflux RND transporter periplasmic adaptor subunit [Flavisolibacter sp.]|nr:efflux RND transporter periplasmic adaptor subunit [Flavisolibacter sp.]
MKLAYRFSSTVLIIAVSALFFFSCSSKRKKEAAAAQKQGSGQRPPARVDYFVVQARPISESIEVSGSIVADESTEIHPEVSGRIISLNVREGAYVNKGAVLAKLYDADLQAQKKKIEVQLQIARQTENRYEQLQKIGGISKQDYDVTALEVSNLRADLDIINTSIARTVVRAPFSGKLGLKTVSTGAFVTPTSIITTIQKTSGLRLDFNVPEKYTGQISTGQFVNFTVEGSSRNYTAVVMATESGIEETTRSLTIRARVRGDETGLVPGGFAKVKLAFEPDPNALMIPTQAVIPQARGKKVYVYRDGTADFIDVTTGVRDSVMVQVTSGLNKGDTVITTGLLGLKPDAKVVLKGANTPARPANSGSAAPQAKR